MRAEGVVVTARPLRRRRRRARLDDGAAVEPTAVVLLFSQDQDFAELADEVRAIAREQQRWLKIASAYARIR